MLAILRKLHAWAGAALCLVIAAVAFSGALLAYKPAWLRATVPGAHAPADLRAERLGRAMAAVEAGFGPGSVSSVTFATPSFGLHQVYLRGGGGAFVDADGRVVQRWGPNGRATEWLFELHRGLLADEVGDAVVGWTGVALAAMSVSGLVLWWPARRSFRGQLLPGQGRAGWLRAHRDVGIMTAPFIVILALTGAALDLPDISRPMMRAEAPPAPKGAGAGPIDWVAAIRAAQARFPDAAVRMALPPAKSGSAASVRLKQPAEWHANGRTIVYLDPADARVMAATDALAQPLGARLFNAFWPIHAARVGGPAWTLVVFLSGVGLGLLSLYGAEAYRRKLFPRRTAGGARKPAPTMA